MVRAQLCILSVVVGLVVGFPATVSCAAIAYSVVFDDPNNDLSSVRSLIEQHVVAAGRRWGGYLVGDASIEVLVKTSSSVPYAEGRSTTNNFVRNNGAFDVYEQGMTAELRTGVDPNAAAPDVEILINPNYAVNELWYDPDPAARTAPVDVNRTDAMSTFLHEFGHALGFSGWINGTTGTFPGTYQSTYDERIQFDGSNFFFTGPEATAVNGTAPPLTYANVAHVANFAPRPGENLLFDVMNGLVFYRGYRYDVSPVDLAILRDAGVPAIYKPGDYDVDRDVDGADLLLWQRTLSAAATTRSGADGNANGLIDAADLAVWRTHFAETVPASPIAATVPEPAALLGSAAASLALFAMRRRSSPLKMGTGSRRRGENARN